LKTSNRICVALSRARNGLYIFGNKKCLKNAAIKIDKNELNENSMLGDESNIYS
jgi:superfamily I DNA and/or RNA helicase